MLVILVGTLAAWRLKLEPELVLVCLTLAAWSLKLGASFSLPLGLHNISGA